MEHIRPKKSLGQNFLVDRTVAAKIVSAFAPAEGELVIEVGPGEGALTRRLVESDATIVAVEIDPRAAMRIRGEFGSRIQVLEDDILAIDIKRLALERGVERARVIGNIPYYITSPILFHLLDVRDSVRDALLMVQKEVAARLTAAIRTKEYGILSVVAQTFTRPRRLFDVAPGSFHPRPRVTSTVVALDFADMEGIAGIDVEHRALIRAAFNQRRKTLRNSLRGVISNETERERILNDAGIRPTARAEELSPADFIRLARLFAHATASGRG